MLISNLQEMQEAVANAPEEALSCIEDQMLERNQVDDLHEHLVQKVAEKDKRRKKRKIMKDFKVNRWGSEVPYIIDGNLRKFRHAPLCNLFLQNKHICSHTANRFEY